MQQGQQLVRKGQQIKLLASGWSGGRCQEELTATQDRGKSELSWKGACVGLLLFFVGS